MTTLPDQLFDPDSPGSFLGKGLAWPIREDPETGDFQRAEDEDSISSGLVFLLETEYGEIPLDEEFGTRVRRLLFSNDLSGITALVTESIERAIREKEKRVQLIKAEFEVFKHPQNPNRLGVKSRIRYRAKATGGVAELVYPFSIEVQT